ncbi:DUF1905 domain-containing protein [Paenibacillus sp. H1-7]|uniref:YdeI/OmpD-associated family protein n=1 Tax=Paenibacillus sp. H1-7 TaxID=2282849 RepID=UPI001EF8A59A|nr:YdeI/OmpD-associated family protein [Paenibacillus sp. H1-7]ULL13606.1 DUF1905 domain-containing protein [Paenibacillus sp. H1-7]
MHIFTSRLIRPEGTGTWTYLDVPFDVEQAFGSRSQVKVKGTVNGVPYRGTLMPHGNGTHYMVVNQSLRDSAGVEAGDMAEVEMEQDKETRTVDVPDDLRAALQMAAPSLLEPFLRLSYSHQKEYIDWIESAKKADTRSRRIEKAVELLQEGKRLKG